MSTTSFSEGHDFVFGRARLQSCRIKLSLKRVLKGHGFSRAVNDRYCGAGFSRGDLLLRSADAVRPPSAERKNTLAIPNGTALAAEICLLRSADASRLPSAERNNIVAFLTARLKPCPFQADLLELERSPL